MGLLYDSGITSADLAQTDISIGVHYDFTFLMTMMIATATPVALSVVTATLRWNDGISNKSHTLVVPLTSLGSYQSVVFPIINATYTNVSLEINNVGLGEYRCLVHNISM